ncbi:fatty acid-binding protein, heart-like [Mytilus californianus]|uniref:fatty acid-binding protein, heart-like n=1 Tax=Mytilus californianus TaxID=6549 RepID=UPI0022470303|nr:fatty acid-binding protein, heart-like [Mytilus californianus]
MALVGTWKYVSADKLEEYMQATGVPENLREVARKNQPTMEISQNGDNWSIKTIVGDKIKDSTFTIGQEFQSTSLIGQPLKCVVTMDGDKMVETQKEGANEVIVTRSVSGDELVSTMSFGSVTATVRFKKA